jgi:hypothetical protein
MKIFWLRTMLHSAESNFSTLSVRISPRIRNRIRKYFSVLVSGLGAVDLWKKTRGRKSRDTVSLSRSNSEFMRPEMWSLEPIGVDDWLKSRIENLITMSLLTYQLEIIALTKIHYTVR